jgi:hypothetical protein
MGESAVTAVDEHPVASSGTSESPSTISSLQTSKAFIPITRCNVIFRVLGPELGPVAQKAISANPGSS